MEETEKHYDALGGEACVRFLRLKAQQEYDKHRKEGEGRKSGPAPVPGHLRDCFDRASSRGRQDLPQPHSETVGADETPKQHPRGAGAGARRGSGSSTSEESEDEEWLP